jgi:hypothetical protein
MTKEEFEPAMYDAQIKNIEANTQKALAEAKLLEAEANLRDAQAAVLENK